MAEIQVHAQFVAAKATNWPWVHCLTLPIESLNTLQFSQRPYKWIRYAIGAVTGSQGDLSFSPDSLNVVDYNTGLPLAPNSVIVYYHTSNEEKQRLFPVDPRIERSAVTSTGSAATTRRTQFREEVAARDKQQCVLTGWEDMACSAVHLLPHIKGDQYISTCTQHRSRDQAGNDIVEAIDSVRNGLFLNRSAHMYLGKDVAFLKTPNFAMDTTDIEPDALPKEKRYTTHLFRLSLPPFFTPGSPVRIPDTLDQWPPDIIFDLVYAGAVLRHFATQELKDMITNSWGDSFYPKGVTTAAKAADETIKKNMTDDKSWQQLEKRRMRYGNHNGQQLDDMDMVMMLPYVLVPPDELKAVFREAEEKRAEMEQKRVEEKVVAWAKEVSSAGMDSP